MYMDAKEANELIMEAVKSAESTGKKFLAIKLCILARDNDKAYDILQRELSRVVSKPPSETQQALLLLADKLLSQQQMASSDVRALENLETLKKLAAFFSAYFNSKPHDCRRLLDELEIIPLSQNSIDVRTKKEKFERMKPSVQKIFGDVAEAELKLLYSDYQRLKQTFRSNQSEFRERELSIRRREDQLLAFIRMIEDKVPNCSKLVDWMRKLRS